MKVPDKIYISKKNLDDNWNQQRCDDIEYIRKTALLEWAKEELSHAIANIDAYPYEDAFRGHREKIEELIAHIESL